MENKIPRRLLYLNTITIDMYHDMFYYKVKKYRAKEITFLKPIYWKEPHSNRFLSHLKGLKKVSAEYMRDIKKLSMTKQVFYSLASLTIHYFENKNHAFLSQTKALKRLTNLQILDSKVGTKTYESKIHPITSLKKATIHTRNATPLMKLAKFAKVLNLDCTSLSFNSLKSMNRLRRMLIYFG